MEDGSPARGADGRDPALAVGNEAARREQDVPLAARVLGVGVKGARTVGRATGIDKAVEIAAEDAIVGAIESEAVERAMARVLAGPVMEEAVKGAVESEAIKRVLESDAVKVALIEALDSELVDEVWRRLLASEEAQQLVERILGAPELRAAIGAQGAGLIGDIGRQVGRLSRRLDATFERAARRLLRRPQRARPTNHAGAISRLLAIAIDGVIISLTFSVLAGVTTLLATLLSDGGANVSAFTIAAGSTAWFVLIGLYLVAFWSLAGRTPGMSFVGIRLHVRRLAPRLALRRAAGFGLSIATLGIGFLGIVFGEERRGWEDRMADTDVVYDERRPEPAPWSQDRLVAAIGPAIVVESPTGVSRPASGP